MKWKNKRRITLFLTFFLFLILPISLVGSGESQSFVSDSFTDESKISAKDGVYVNTTDDHVRLVIPYDSEVDTTAGPLGMLPPYHFSFDAKGLSWVWYSDGSQMRFKTTSNGVDWSSSTEVRSASHWDCFELFYDTISDKVYYACTPLVAGNIFFRSGTPNSDGSITWTADEEEISTDYEYAFYVKINVDANGVVWIAHQDRTALSGGNHYPYVVKSGNNNGTWGTTPAGFPHQLSTTNDETWRVIVVRQLALDDMYVIYARDGQQPLGKMWDGSSWDTEENDVTDYPVWADATGHPFMSASTVGANIYFVYVRDATPKQIRFNKRTWLGGWQTNDELVQTDTTSLMFPAIVGVSGSLQYCFWGNNTSDKIVYKKRVSGSWDADYTEWISVPDFDSRAISPYYEDYDSKIGMLYLNSSSTPIGIRFNWLDLGTNTGILYSTNLLSGESVSSIDQFNYTCTVPSQTTLHILFSQNNATWKNSTDGTAWQSLTAGTNQTISLTSLSWPGANFYYKCGFNNTDDSTPNLDYIAVLYTTTNGNGNGNGNGETPVSYANYLTSEDGNVIMYGGIKIRPNINHTYIPQFNGRYKNISLHDDRVGLAKANDDLTIECLTSDNTTIDLHQWFYDYRTRLQPYSPTASELSFQINSQSWGEPDSISGVTTHSYDDDTTTLTFSCSNNSIVLIRWSLLAKSGVKWYLDRMMMFIGIGGLFMVMIAPVMFMVYAKDSEWDKAFLWGLMLFVIGMALIIGWLWG